MTLHQLLSESVEVLANQKGILLVIVGTQKMLRGKGKLVAWKQRLGHQVASRKQTPQRGESSSEGNKVSTFSGEAATDEALLFPRPHHLH